MTEQEYINLSARVNIEHALFALKQVVPKSTEEIDSNEFKEIVTKLTDWKYELFRLTT